MTKKNQIIPVIDLKNNEIVKATEGRREEYKSLKSSLTDLKRPAEIVHEMIKKTKSNILYIADLDAIDGYSLQEKTILEILCSLNNVEIWLDGGYKSYREFLKFDLVIKNLLSNDVNITPVFSSESIKNLADAKETFHYYPMAILSLDKKNGDFLCKSQISSFPDLWPQKIILMNLDRVGSCLGPDIVWFKEVKSKNPFKMIYGAGGIRCTDDIKQINSVSADGWLCSSIIHSEKDIMDY